MVHEGICEDQFGFPLTSGLAPFPFQWYETMLIG